MKSNIKRFYPWFLLILFFAAGIISEIAIKNGIHFLIVPDLLDISKVLLGIQSTVAVLSLSVLALLGSFVDKTYWGISVADFYSNKKNPYFTSLTAIILTLILLVCSFFSLLYNKYNLIIMLFLATLFIILYTTIQIYQVFKGENTIKNDIEEMYSKAFEPGKSLSRKIELFNIYCNGWKKQITEQSSSSFQDYEETFFDLFNKLLKEKNEKCIIEICQMSKEILNSLLTDSNEAKKKEGLELIKRIYYTIAFLDIHENSKFLQSFSLLSELIQVFLEALKSISPQWLGENFDWYNFIGYVDTVAFRYELTARNDELTSSLRIAIQMGIL